MSYAAQASPIESKNGWKACLSLSFEKGPSRPIVRRRHTGPLTIQRPFFPEESVAHVYLLHPPGGVVGGDELSINARAHSGAAGLVTTPGATKFYRSNGLISSMEQVLEVTAGSLEWFPQENIFFNACNAVLSTTVDTDNDAAWALWDIHCFGRPASNDVFESGSVSARLNVLVNGVPTFMDRLIVDENHPLSRRTALRGHSVSGTLLLNKMTADCAEIARKSLHENPEFFVTLVDSLLVVRYLGDSAQQAKDGFTEVWSNLRYLLNQRVACAPRIWAT